MYQEMYIAICIDVEVKIYIVREDMIISFLMLHLWILIPNNAHCPSM